MRTCSIIIPAFNEEKRLGPTLESISRAVAERIFDPVTITEIIIVDDGSTDDTLAVAEQCNDLPVHILKFSRNRGKGAAVQTGMLEATGDFLLMYDADGATPINEIPKLFKAIASGADIAIGSRVLGTGEGLKSMAIHRRFIGRAYWFFCSRLIPGIRDAACGCKLFSREAGRTLFREQRVHRFAFDIEILALALRHRYIVREISVRWTAVPESRVHILFDGPEMFFSILRLYLARSSRRSTSLTSQET